MLVGRGPLSESKRPGHHCGSALGMGGGVAFLPIYRKRPRWSPAYMIQPSPSCLILLCRGVPCACCLDLVKADSKGAARMGMMAMTTKSPTKAKPELFFKEKLLDSDSIKPISRTSGTLDDTCNGG